MIENIKIISQILGLFVLVIFILKKTHKTHIESLITGSIFIVALFGAAYLLNLSIITSLIHYLLPFIILSTIVIFQPEIRQSLNFIGKAIKINNFFHFNPSNGINKTDAEHIMQAVTELSRARIGALLVLENEMHSFNSFTSGIKINADLSALLLISLFYPNSPLHDGAVIIKKNKITMAGVLLPLDHTSKLNPRYGTRHRAALGASNIFSGLCIVVSEETGSISIAQNGSLRKIISIQELRIILNNYYNSYNLTTRQLFEKRQLESIG